MAEKRMFTKKIIDSDAFLDMPLSTQALYFHLSMRADDEGFVNSPKKISRMVGASDDELKVLIAKGFVIGFESGVIVIKHWKMHNIIRGDRLIKTSHTFEKSLLYLKENGAYTVDVSQVAGICQSDDGIDKIRLDKIRLDKDTKVSILDSIPENDLELAKELIAYRKKIKKPLKTEKGIKDLISSIHKIANAGYDLRTVVELMQSKEWLSIKLDWVQKEFNQSKPQYKTVAEKNKEFLDNLEKKYKGEVIDAESY